MADTFIGSVLASIMKDMRDTSAVFKVSPNCITTYVPHRHIAFRRFRDLPTELRLEIWRLALPPPRGIEVYYSTWEKRWLCRLDDYASHTALREVNLEARNVFFKQYLCFLPFEQQTTKGKERLPRPVSFINPAIDTLYISTRQSSAPSLDVPKTFALLKMPALKNITHIAFVPELFPATLIATGPKRPSPVGFFKRFKMLKSLTIVIGDSDSYFQYYKRDDGRIKGSVKFPIAFPKCDWSREYRCVQVEMNRKFQQVVDAFKPGMEAGLEGRDVTLEFKAVLRYGRQ